MYFFIKAVFYVIKTCAFVLYLKADNIQRKTKKDIRRNNFADVFSHKSVIYFT